MEYKLKSPLLQDIETKTVRITALASELGVVTATTISIPLANLRSDVTAADVLIAQNYTDGTKATASIVGTDLVLTDAAIAASDVFNLVLRLK